MKKVLSLIIILFFLLVPISTNAQTQGTEGITLSPIFSELNLKPGESTNIKLTIQNNEEQEIKCKVEYGELRETEPQSGKYELFKVENQTENILSPSTKEFNVKGKGIYELPVIVTMPSSPSKASYFPVILIGVEPTNDSAFSSQGEIGSIVYLNLNLSGQEGSQFGFDVSPYMKIKLEVIKKIVSFPFNTFRVTIQNTGSTYIKPFGNIVVLDNKNTKLKDIPVNEKLKILLPNQTLESDFDWQQYGPKDLGKYLVPRFGKYKAGFGAISGEGRQNVQDTFWVIPYYHILVVLIVGSYIAYKLKGKKKSKNRREP